jgi:thioredoxin-related protein
MSPQTVMPLIFAILLNQLVACSVAADPANLSVTGDLKRLGAESMRKKLPILLIISQSHCGYCERMKREVLNPMQINGDFENRILVREIIIDSSEQLTDFDGNRVDAADFSQSYGVYVTPTLLFLNSRGEVAAEPILGINNIDYMLFYIQDAVDMAVKQAF